MAGKGTVLAIVGAIGVLLLITFVVLGLSFQTLEYHEVCHSGSHSGLP